MKISWSLKKIKLILNKQKNIFLSLLIKSILPKKFLKKNLKAFWCLVKKTGNPIKSNLSKHTKTIPDNPQFLPKIKETDLRFMVIIIKLGKKKRAR